MGGLIEGRREAEWRKGANITVNQHLMQRQRREIEWEREHRNTVRTKHTHCAQTQQRTTLLINSNEKKKATHSEPATPGRNEQH